MATQSRATQRTLTRATAPLRAPIHSGRGSRLARGSTAPPRIVLTADVTVIDG